MQNMETTLARAATPRQTMSLDEVHNAVRRDDLLKWDTTAARSDLAFKDGRLALVPNDVAGTDETRLALTPWALGQMCARLGIPVAYFRKCPSILQDQQANYWLKAGSRANGSHTNGSQVLSNGRGPNGASQGSANGQGDPWLLRARGETLRAVLSDRYSPLDNRTLLEQLRLLLSARYRVDWFGLSEESLHLRIVDPQRTREVLPDDALTVGIHLSNSEIGFRAVTVDALVYRLVCKNGLIRMVKGKSLLRQRHIHIAEPRFVAALEEAVESALTEADGFLEQLRRTTKTPVPDVEDALKKLGERWHLSQNTQDAVQSALRQEPARVQETLYGVVNAFTSAAQRLPDEDRYDLEVLAGHLAEHGLAPFALSRREQSLMQKSSASQNGEAEAAGTEVEAQADEIPTGASIFEMAREMFEAQVVGRSPQPAEVTA